MTHRVEQPSRRFGCGGQMGRDASRLWLPGTPVVCYRPRRSKVHLGNVGLNTPSNERQSLMSDFVYG